MTILYVYGLLAMTYTILVQVAMSIIMSLVMLLVVVLIHLVMTLVLYIVIVVQLFKYQVLAGQVGTIYYVFLYIILDRE